MAVDGLVRESRRTMADDLEPVMPVGPRLGRHYLVLRQATFARIEKELGRKINQVYAEFDVEPIAAASLGQVYRAKLFTGEEVAVKVQRPNLAAIIKGDIEILRKVTKFAERFPSLNENADWAGMLR